MSAGNEPDGDAVAAIASDAPALTAEQQELVAALHRSFQQAARGETRSVWEFLEELRQEDEAAGNEDRDNGRV